LQDSRELLVEGILTGPKGYYDCPVLLNLFGTSEATKKDDLKKRMQQDKLPVSKLVQTDRDAAKKAKDQAVERKKAEKHARAMALGKAAQQFQANDNSMFANLSVPTGLGTNESLEELLSQSSSFNPREVGQVVESFGQKEADLAKMPMADSPEGLSTQLLPYQRQGLAWMIAQESPQLPAPDSDAVVQLWKRDGSKFTNIATNFSTATAPHLASGGILADDMGLGKTIQVISLIMANPTPRTSESSKTTLILAPVGVMSNWRNQIQEHTKSETAPRVLIYHGSGKKEAANLASYDVVVSSYGALALDYKPDARKAPVQGNFLR
jgi:Superfamily II DNA/RNA helicases, SNF2 family